jgi:hypothetical protein
MPRRAQRRFGDFAIEHGLTRECKARPTQSKRGGPGSGGREPGITFHLSVTYKDEMVEEIGQLADAVPPPPATPALAPSPLAPTASPFPLALSPPPLPLRRPLARSPLARAPAYSIGAELGPVSRRTSTG